MLCPCSVSQPGSEEHDPALLWYVDIRCEGRTLPSEPEAARQWFLENAPLIQCGLAKCADELQVGVDTINADVRPYKRELPERPGGTTLRVFVSAIRRMDARNIASELRAIGDQWTNILRALRSLASV